MLSTRPLGTRRQHSGARCGVEAATPAPRICSCRHDMDEQRRESAEPRGKQQAGECREELCSERASAGAARGGGPFLLYRENQLRPLSAGMLPKRGAKR